MSVRVWRCRRVKAGIKCGTLNLRIKQRCTECGAPRPKASRPKHMAALDLPYEEYVRINGGEFCGICGKPPSPTRKLDRDHCHRTGEARGVLCHICNRALGNRDAQWLRRAAFYLEQVDERKRAAGTLDSAPEAPITPLVCVYCGLEEGHSKRCSVTKFGVAERKEQAGRDAA